MLALAISSRAAVAGRRSQGRPTARPSGSQRSQGYQQASAQPSSATSGQLSYFKQGAGPEAYASGKDAQRGERLFAPTRAVFSSDEQQESLESIAHVVPPVSSRQPPEAGAPVPAWHALIAAKLTN